MINQYLINSSSGAIPLRIVSQRLFADWLVDQPVSMQRWLKSSGFEAKTDTFCLIPDNDSGLAQVIVGCDDALDFLQFGNLPIRLPAGVYAFDEASLAGFALDDLALAWGMGAYQFTLYKAAPCEPAQLALALADQEQRVSEWLDTISLVRDLINTPTEHMGPEQLAQVASSLASEFGAQCHEIVGEALLAENYPCIHAVGRASDRPPRLIDLRWGHPDHPKLTLVGKGVCFDTGGLNLKPAAGMLLMKKDMSGAAHALGLARMVMLRQLPVRLRVLIPAVENSVSGNSYRPGDVIKARNGKTIEITNTDAEGRVVLADALTEASSEQPEWLFDFASLTGAARVALGPYIPSFFCNDDDLANALFESGRQAKDLVWRVPLHAPYLAYMQSICADLVNASPVPFAGSITAALFLQAFLVKPVKWTHFDFTAWNDKSLPGRPAGGEVLAIRGVFHFLEQALRQ